MNVKRELSALRAPDERGAQQRAWQLVSAAHRARTPVTRRRSRRTLAIVPAVIAIVAGLALSPAGATVGRLISHALGVPHAAQKLLPLPAPGRLLVSGGAGTWIVSTDGARRRIARWGEASWSPHGRYIAVASGDQLAAMNPRGAMQWALRRPAVSDPRWYAPSGFRVAYRSQDTLRVVAGDGTGDRRLASGVAPVAPAWRPAHPYQLAYITQHHVALTDADSGRMLWERPADDASKLQWSADGARLLIVSRNDARVLTGAGETIASLATGAGPLLDGSLSPDGQAVALVRDGVSPGTITARLGLPRPHLSTVLSGPGMRQVLWSPNGRWLLISWPAANQWAFVAVAGKPRIAATSRIAQQFPGGPHRDSFPRLDGWCCAAHVPSG